MDLPKLPYRAEYAKSGRAGCKRCKEAIAKDSLRLAHMVQSHFFDGMQPSWYHHYCFFEKFRPKSVTDIEHFESLRWDDQETIRNKISQLINDPKSTAENVKGSKSRKRNNAEANSVPDLADYTVEYAKSKRSKCKVCEEFIDKNEVRISKKDYENEVARQYGPTERWHHVDCFIKAREELRFFASASILPGFKALSPDDQKMLKSKIPAIQGTDITCGPSPTKKPKEDANMKKKLKQQSDTMFKFRDSLEALTKHEITSLLNHNDQDSECISAKLDLLSDIMAFGALKKCEKCKGQLIFQSGVGYQCLGNISEWTKCQSVYAKPERVFFKVPSELKDKYEFLKKYKGKVGERLFTQVSEEKTSTSSTSKKSKPVLDSLKFFIHKTDSKTSNDVKKQIEDLGGSVVKKWEEGVFAVVSTNVEVEKSKLTKVLKSAKDVETVVIPDTFFDDITVTTSREDFINMFKEKKISPWNSDESRKLQTTTSSKSVYRSQPSKSMFKSGITSQKVTLKDGLAVDPDSLLDKIAHVYRKGDDVYSVVLGLTDVQTGKNSYYKLQVLRSDEGKKFWLFRSWGRIGTTIGGNKVEEHNLDTCIEIFEELFEEKSGNRWEDRKNFKKVPGKMMMLDVHYQDKKMEEEMPKLMRKSETLPEPVQDLISLIFDIEAMKKTMMEFELDLNKMPLGKLSQKQIQNAFSTLSELQNLLTSAAEKHLIIEKTNIFYTLVPHDCGINVPPILDNEDLIKQKIDMLNSLMDIEIAYKLLEECKDSDNSIDEHYNKLKADISIVDKGTDEYKMIELYVKNTHAKTHMNYTLSIEHVFKIERKDEAKRFKKFSKFSNRRLLWHGSRITNFAGILSQGLRIAPPEAPVTGYMFGKGIYFADMVSKSANYCNTTKKNPTGLLLLCEVALGNMHELKYGENIVKLPSGKDSVKGLGQTEPDPKEKVISPSGAEVIIGKGIDSKIRDSALLYNEYIVYNVGQVKIRYLLRVKFNYKI